MPFSCATWLTDSAVADDTAPISSETLSCSISLCAFCAANAGLAAQKAHKLIEQDKVSLLMGAVSSATALSVNQVAHEKGMVYMVTGGHTDPVTRSEEHTSEL